MSRSRRRLPSSLLSNTMAELQRGQKVTDTGTPLTTSLTISCHMEYLEGVGPGVVVDLEGDDRLIAANPLVCV